MLQNCDGCHHKELKLKLKLPFSVAAWPASQPSQIGSQPVNPGNEVWRGGKGREEGGFNQRCSRCFEMCAFSGMLSTNLCPDKL